MNILEFQIGNIPISNFSKTDAINVEIKENFDAKCIKIDIKNINQLEESTENGIKMSLQLVVLRYLYQMKILYRKN